MEGHTLGRLFGWTRIEHAIHQPAGYNTMPMSLTSVFLLGGSVSQLLAVYHSLNPTLQPWVESPSPLSQDDEVSARFGLSEFQRAIMNFYSLSYNLKAAETEATWVTRHLLRWGTDGKQLVAGLFTNLGRSLMLLGDGFELPNALVIIQALALAAVDWDPMFQDMMYAVSETEGEGHNFMSPEDIFAHVGQDGRFSGFGTLGPQNYNKLLADAGRRLAIIQYVRRLDTAQFDVDELSRLSVKLACAAHKPGQPAFDVVLSKCPALVVCLRVLLQHIEDPVLRHSLTRGVFMLIVIAYIAELRPIFTRNIVLRYDQRVEDAPRWDRILSTFYKSDLQQPSKYADIHFLRLLRSIRKLATHDHLVYPFYEEMASHLIERWTGWTGYGRPGEVYLNVRL